MTQDLSQPTSDPTPTLPLPINRVRVGLVLTIIGFIIYLIGVRPDLFGLDRSPVIGFVQIAVFLVGLSIICLGGYICLMALWKGQVTSIAADIGFRLVATGYVISVFTGMADIFGFGSHPFPIVPYFGKWQAFGVVFGEVIIAIGFLMLIPYARIQAHRKQQDSNPAQP